MNIGHCDNYDEMRRQQYDRFYENIIWYAYKLTIDGKWFNTLALDF